MYADWKRSFRLFVETWLSRRRATARSRSLDTNDRFETGLGNSRDQDYAFFSKGATRACFMLSGTTPDDNEALTSRVRNGLRRSTWSFNIHVGRGSREQDLVADLSISLHVSLSEAGSKESRGVTSAIGSSGSCNVAVATGKDSRIASIFVEKKVPNIVIGESDTVSAL